MKPSEIFERNREVIRDLVAQYPLANPRLFGSVLHGTDRDDSDIDILVDALPGTTLLDLIGLERKLSERLGAKVQVVTPRELSRYFRENVLREALPV